MCLFGRAAGLDERGLVDVDRPIVRGVTTGVRVETAYQRQADPADIHARTTTATNIKEREA